MQTRFVTNIHTYTVSQSFILTKSQYDFTKSQTVIRYSFSQRRSVLKKRIHSKFAMNKQIKKQSANTYLIAVVVHTAFALAQIEQKPVHSCWLYSLYSNSIYSSLTATSLPIEHCVFQALLVQMIHAAHMIAATAPAVAFAVVGMDTIFVFGLHIAEKRMETSLEKTIAF